MPAQRALVLSLLWLVLLLLRLPHHRRRVWKGGRLARSEQRLELPRVHLSTGGPSSHAVEGRRACADAPGLLYAAEPSTRWCELVVFLLRGWREGDVLGRGLEDRGGIIVESKVV
jgi:hypothetical protein